MKTTLIFDFDGTLLDSLNAFFDVFQRYLKESRNRDVTREDFLQLFKGNIWENLANQGFTEQDRTAVWKYFPSAFAKSHLFEGMDTAIRSLKSRGCDLHILTSNDAAFVTQKLDECGIADLFSTIKSDNNGSKAVVLQRDFGTVQGCVYIGDTMGDIKAGKAAGMKTIAVTWGYHDEQTLRTASPDVIVDEPSQLLALL